MRTSSPRSVLNAEPRARACDDAPVSSLLCSRETTSGRHAASAEARLLRWSMGRWMAPHGLQSGYCALSGAKSTIALAFSTDGTYFASTHGDHTVKARRVASPAAGAPVHMLKPARARVATGV